VSGRTPLWQVAQWGMIRYDSVMPRDRFAKIAITLPPEDLAEADRLATEQDRSRSWIIAEALRQYVARSTGHRASSDLDPSRTAQLRRDLLLSPQERIEAADQALRIVGDGRASAAQEPLTFPTFDAFLEWNRERATTP
jgi:Ribbon-helix-helix protein, copG family